VVGVAGGYCAGKNAVVELLRERGYQEIDVDRIGHEVLELPEVRRSLARLFGSEILDPAGAVDRRALGRRVFSSRGELRRLEQVVHPVMAQRVGERIRAASGPVVVNAAILFRMDLQRMCDRVICVRAGLLRRLRRAWRRDRCGPLAALRRIFSQRGICPKSGPGFVDTYYVGNNGTLAALRARVLSVLRQKGFGTR
jgi:dephospho-CoA kinase